MTPSVVNTISSTFSEKSRAAKRREGKQREAKESEGKQREAKGSEGKRCEETKRRELNGSDVLRSRRGSELNEEEAGGDPHRGRS